jgi:hypothetical protein
MLAASIIRAMMMMEEESTYETSANFYQTTRRYNPADSHLHYDVSLSNFKKTTTAGGLLVGSDRNSFEVCK